MCVSILALREKGDDRYSDNDLVPKSVSILALREKGDAGIKPEARMAMLFQSSPFVRRATALKKCCTGSMWFQSSPFVRRATKAYIGTLPVYPVSILALREKGDPAPLGRIGGLYGFNPRPS